MAGVVHRDAPAVLAARRHFVDDELGGGRRPEPVVSARGDGVRVAVAVGGNPLDKEVSGAVRGDLRLALVVQPRDRDGELRSERLAFRVELTTEDLRSLSDLLERLPVKGDRYTPAMQATIDR